MINNHSDVSVCVFTNNTTCMQLNCDVIKDVVYILDLELDICKIGPPIEVHVHILHYV